MAVLRSPPPPGRQGLAVHGRGGVQLCDAALPPAVVEAAYRYSLASGVSLCAFLGDTCATPRLTPDIRQLHDTYYEPLAEVVATASALLAGPHPVRKLLFMSDAATIAGSVLPYWLAALPGTGAEPMQAVDTMLEIVPAGVNKWGGCVALLDHLGLPAAALMAVGDGGNDLAMLAGAGLGVAMGNAVPGVRAAADVVVAGHDEGGVAEAFERFVL
ncbi:Phosphatase YidA [Tetrabaena socialis]|uniref:Phosphatase YidA n=1 Tax=Tetrabaena socialis TaxID=47790 RepID=A0A2J8A2G0_9CHLO|nr:Phosphatase YidA [Tetrabaena socialis]|eukprot:PNH06702.1 Phosphatase YidA [Tetrabaena socialis]